MADGISALAKAVAHEVGIFALAKPVAHQSQWHPKFVRVTLSEYPWAAVFRFRSMSFLLFNRLEKCPILSLISAAIP